jgi:hypothetical protein
MDLLHFLRARLKFIEQLYDGAVSPFEKTKRKIEHHKSPYIDDRNPEYVTEPAFLAEWQQADDSIMVVGHWALCMVQASLNAYLRECIGPIGSIWWKPETLHGELSKKKKKDRSWFECYRLLFLEDLEIDWNKGPVPLTELEQLNLTRNDLIHNLDMLSMSVMRDEKHVERFPTGLFTDELWSGLGMERVRVDKKKLMLAIELVEKFCAWIDSIRCMYPKYLKVEPKTDQSV